MAAIQRPIAELAFSDPAGSPPSGAFTETILEVGGELP